MTTHKVKYDGIEFTIDGNFIPGENQTNDNPGYPDEFETENIYISDQEVTNIIRESVKTKIEEIIYQNYYA